MDVEMVFQSAGLSNGDASLQIYQTGIDSIYPGYPAQDRDAMDVEHVIL